MFPKYRCKNCQASYSEHLKSEELVGQTLEMLSSGYANFECEGVLTQVRVAGGAKHAQMFSLIAHICKYPRDGEIGIAELIGFTREHPPN